MDGREESRRDCIRTTGIRCGHSPRGPQRSLRFIATEYRELSSDPRAVFGVIDGRMGSCIQSSWAS